MDLKRLVYDALLIALCTVLGYVSIDMQVMKLTLENLPVIIGAVLFGPVDGMLIGGIGTLLYQMLKYGLDATTVLWVIPYVISGLFVGFVAKKKNFDLKLWEMIVLLVVNGLIVTGLNTVSLFIAYKYVYMMPTESVIAAIPTRLLTSVAKSVIYALAVPLLVKGLKAAKLL
ncbi:MAG: folate family ECF transporter S component [Lachnospiraceae bacterium]|nr:folate family ECF transporter S component [Lachnospiraceae bacterium]